MAWFVSRSVQGSFEEILQAIGSEDPTAAQTLQQIHSLAQEVASLAAGIAQVEGMAEAARQLQAASAAKQLQLSKDKKYLRESLDAKDKALDSLLAQLEQSKAKILAMKAENDAARKQLMLQGESFPSDIVTAKLAAAHLMELIRKHDALLSIIPLTERQSVLRTAKEHPHADAGDKAQFVYVVYLADRVYNHLDALHALSKHDIPEQTVADALSAVYGVYKRTYGEPRASEHALFSLDKNALSPAVWHSGFVRTEAVEQLNGQLYALVASFIASLEQLYAWAKLHNSHSVVTECQSIILELYELLAKQLVVHHEKTEELVNHYKRAIQALEADTGQILTKEPEDLSPLLAELRQKRSQKPSPSA